MPIAPRDKNGIGLPNLGLEMLKGTLEGYQSQHKFGHNEDIGTTYEPITDDGIYRTPTAATSLEIVSDSANDTSAGTGARKVKVYGLDANWELLTQEVTMNGTTAVALATDLVRVFRMYVTESGTYATQSAGSHAGNLVLREAGAGQEWAKINDAAAAGFPLGQTEIGVFTVPAGMTAYIPSIHIHVDSSKTVDVTAFQRQNADVVTAPFGVMRTWGQYHGISGHSDLHPETPFGPFPEKTDVGFMGKVSTGSGSCLIDFEIWLIDNDVLRG